MKYGDIHLHALDQFDSQNDPDRVCKKLKEMGARAFALTQHGVLSGIEPMREAAARHGLKFVPGIETYYGNDGDLMQNQHLILLAEDDTGYQAICMAVSDSQNKAGFSVMTKETLAAYFGPGGIGHGHVIATSACVQGPLAAILRKNEIIDREEEKIRKRAGVLEDVSVRLAREEKRKGELEEKAEKAKEERDAAKKLAEMKFTARERKVAGLVAKNDPCAEEERKNLEKDKKMSEAAAGEFIRLKAEYSSLLREVSAANQVLKDLKEQQEKYLLYKERMDALEGQRKSREELYQETVREALRLKELFGEDYFFIEVQYHRIPLEAEIYPVLVKVAKETGIEIVASNDVHMVDGSEEERLRRQIMRSMRFGNAWEEESVGDSELYIKTDDDMYEMLREILSDDDSVEAVGYIQVILDRCHVEFASEKHYPAYPVQLGETANGRFETEIMKGIAWRFPDGLPNGYKERLRHEVRVIESMGYADYHLIVKDFLEYGRALAPVPADRIEEAPLTIEEAKKWVSENGWTGGISIGPGRGSAAGSLVCYLLGITSLDPIKYQLLFERFLNPERVSMPDIDCDMSNKVRAKVIEYVRNKYGKDSVCGILTMNAQAPKGAIRIAAKYYGLRVRGDGTAFKALGDEMARKVPGEPGTTFATEIETEDENRKPLMDILKGFYDKSSDACEILRMAGIVEGMFTTYGAHAAGIVISDKTPIKNYLPLRWNESLHEYTTQCDMVKVEEKGCLKMDFLGLRTLDIISGCLKNIERSCGRVIDPMDIPLDDKNVFEKIFQKGNTNSVFQFESAGMKSMLQRFVPSSFEDLIILVSMFRPGPLQYIDDVIDVKHGRKAPVYLTPELETILGKTYAGIVYQEQVMEIFQKLAGYTLGGADQVRRYMSKKKMDKLAHEREAFVSGDPVRHIPGCVANGIDEAAANQLFDQMTEFAKYAFNRSHAACYALLSYWTGWLKCYYPAEFLAEAMNWASDDQKVRGLMKEASHFKVGILPPSVNDSDDLYTVKDGKILIGLSVIRNVAADGSRIIEEREKNGAYKSLIDLLMRVRINKNALENLTKAGAMDVFCPNRQAVLAILKVYQDLIKKYTEKMDLARGLDAVIGHLSEVSSDAELMELQNHLGVTVLERLLPESKVRIRLENARKAAKDARDTLGEVEIPTDIEEDMQQRLREEHEMLGAYVTGHPLNEYPECSALGAEPIESVNLRTRTIYGIITDLRIKARKSDGKPMAFFNLEDRTGGMEVCVFVKQYAACEACIKEGGVVKVTGKVAQEVLEKDDGDEVTYKMMAEAVQDIPVDRKVTISVSSYALFHVEREVDFRRKYERKDGCRCAVYDRSLDVTRNLTYRVDAQVQSCFA